ncbi:MAG: NAD(P)H-binding protein [Mucilaginibacter sp.]|nr:NAD(P)H-binding protein [Mucilaginibacter sp.]
MRILVIGASGRVGRQLTHKLLKLGHQVTGTSTNRMLSFDSPNYNHLLLDITEELPHLKPKISGDFEAIFFVAGSGEYGLLEIDLHGAVKTMQIAETKGIERYIMLSFAFSLEPERWEEEGESGIADYGIAKHYADEWLLRNTKLNYTILQPCTLTETPGTGKIAVNIKHHLNNSIEDVASTLVEVLDNPSAFKKVITMHHGNVPIHEAISSL